MKIFLNLILKLLFGTKIPYEFSYIVNVYYYIHGNVFIDLESFGYRLTDSHLHLVFAFSLSLIMTL